MSWGDEEEKDAWFGADDAEDEWGHDVHEPVEEHIAASVEVTPTDSKSSSPDTGLEPGALPSGPSPSGPLPSGPSPIGHLPSGPSPNGPLPSGYLPSGPLPSGPLPSGPLPSGPSLGLPIGPPQPKARSALESPTLSERKVDDLQSDMDSVKRKMEQLSIGAAIASKKGVKKSSGKEAPEPGAVADGGKKRKKRRRARKRKIPEGHKMCKECCTAQPQSTGEVRGVHFYCAECKEYQQCADCQKYTHPSLGKEEPSEKLWYCNGCWNSFETQEKAAFKTVDPDSYLTGRYAVRESTRARGW